MNIDIYSFFSGIGILDLGFEKENYNIVFVNEYNKAFLDAYKFARRKMAINEPYYGYYNGNINDLLYGEEKLKLSQNVLQSKSKGLVGFIGGPPCPDFSVAGKNEGITGKNGSLTMSYKKIILSQKPDFFLFENVKGLWSTKKHREEYKKIKKSLNRCGYILIDKVVNSLEYGVPQDRERIILFGIKYDILSDNRKCAKDYLIKNFKWGALEEYSIQLINQCNWPTTREFNENSVFEQPLNIIPELTVEYWFRKNNVYSHYNANDFFKPKSDRISAVKEGDVSKKSFKRLNRWRYSPTAAYGNNEVHLHPYKNRRISVAEALSIQSLPEEFVVTKEITKSEMFKAIGNGVPYLLSKALAHQIENFFENYFKEENNE